MSRGSIENLPQKLMEVRNECKRIFKTSFLFRQEN